MLSTRNKFFMPALTTILLQTSHVQAFGLLDAYEAALKNDPIYRAATHEDEAGQQAAEIGRAGLLPNLSISHTQSKNASTREIKGTPGSSQPQDINQDINYDSQVSTLSLRQPLLNLEAVAGYRQGLADANSSRARFTGHSQQLVVRLVEAYVETLNAQDHLKLIEAKRDALEELKQVNERMLQKGEGTTTDVLETQSKYALSQAQVIEARDELAVAKLKLTAVVGKEVLQLDRLSDTFQIKAIQLSDYDSWQALALDRNAELVTQRHAVVSVKEEIKKSRSGHAPRVDLVASLSRNKSPTFFATNQIANIASVGIELNIPLYAGGRVNAVTSRAQANHARAEADLDAIKDKVLIELRRQYKLLSSSIKRIESLELAVESAQLLIEATQKSIQGGIRINLDLLDAQEQFFTARHDLSEARYNYLLAYLRLQQAAGTLVLDDLQKIAAYFIPEN